MVYDREQYLLKQKMMNQAEQQIPDQLVEQPIDPGEYLSTMISLYRQDQADYRGRRNGDQELIAELASEEADEYFDGALITVLDLVKLKITPGIPEIAVKPDEATEVDVTLGGLKEGASLRDMRNAWRQLWVGASILTNRLHRDSPEFRNTGLPELFEMSDKNKSLVMDELFGNFQDLNALRFGATGSGVMRKKRIPDLDGGEPLTIKIDADKAASERGIANNAARRGYTARRRKDEATGAVHPAGKMFPEEFVALRKQHPQVDMDQFAQDVAFLKDVGEYYEQHQE